MFSLSRPTDATVDELLRRVADRDFTYGFHGLTRGGPPQTIPLDFHQELYKTQLGKGPEIFALAADAMQRWEMYATSFTFLSANKPPEEDLDVAVLIKHLGFWSANPLRVVYHIANANRFGFGVGTLPGHAECGEERFLVKQDSTGSVWFEILSLSKPQATLAQVGAPIVKSLQKQFAKESMKAMHRAIRANPAYVRAQGQSA